MKQVFDISNQTKLPISACNYGYHSDTDPYLNYDLGTGDYTVTVLVRATAVAKEDDVANVVLKGKPFEAYVGPINSGAGGWSLWVGKNSFGITSNINGLSATSSPGVQGVPVDLFDGWHHLAIARRDGILHAYVDFEEYPIAVDSGDAAASMSGGGAFYSLVNGGDIMWNYGIGMSVGSFPGQVCLITLWASALLGDDLRATVIDPDLVQIGPPYDSLIGFWPLDGDFRDLSSMNKSIGIGTNPPTTAFVDPGSNTGADKNGSLQDAAQYLAACRYAFAMRYLNAYDGRVAMTPAEVSALCGAGLRIGSVWEPSTGVSYFTETQGQLDAASAFAAAKAINQPGGSAIYFAVDFNVTATQYTDNINPYFTGIAKQANPEGYVIAAYGSGFVLQSLLNDKLTAKTWLSESYGWDGYDAFKGECDLLQSSISVDPYVPDYVCGVEIDTNTITSGHEPLLWTVGP